MKGTVALGISGGVDSSVSALLLKQAGYRVEAVFMKNWEEDDQANYCSAASDLKDAQMVCDRLKIPLHPVNFSSEYWDRVFEKFLKELTEGKTPNPDVLCNQEIKFGVFWKFVQTQLSVDWMATGHYAQRSFDRPAKLFRSVDQLKDQTYFLYQLNQIQLQRTLFPIGHLNKKQVREIALKNGLITAQKKILLESVLLEKEIFLILFRLIYASLRERLWIAAVAIWENIEAFFNTPWVSAKAWGLED